MGTEISSVNTYTSAYTTAMGASPTTTLAQDEILLTSYIGNDTSVNVPNKYTVNGVEYKVVLSPYINNNYGTFTNNTSITSIYLKNGIKAFSNNMSGVFSGCTSLTSVPTIPNSVTNISSLFSGCTSITNIDLSNINLSNITSYSNAFNYVPSNATITVSNCIQYKLFKTMFGNNYTGLTTATNINDSFYCYYQEVEYIRSTGTQYINTGVKGVSDLKAVTEINITDLPSSNTPFFGGYGNSQRCYFLLVNSDGSVGISYISTTMSSVKLSKDTNYIIESDFTRGNQTVTCSHHLRSGGFSLW